MAAFQSFESGVYHICNIWESKPIILIIFFSFVFILHVFMAAVHDFGTVLASL